MIVFSRHQKVINGDTFQTIPGSNRLFHTCEWCEISFGPSALSLYMYMYMIHRSSRYEHVTPMLQDPHWLWYPERIDLKLAVLVYQCLHGLVPWYLSDYIQHVADSNHCRLRSSSSWQLVIRRTRLSTVGDRAFPVAGSRLWNSLPPDVTQLQC